MYMYKMYLCVLHLQIVLGGWDEFPQLKKNPLKATILQMTSQCISTSAHQQCHALTTYMYMYMYMCTCTCMLWYAHLLPHPLILQVKTILS